MSCACHTSNARRGPSDRPPPADDVTDVRHQPCGARGVPPQPAAIEERARRVGQLASATDRDDLDRDPRVQHRGRGLRSIEAEDGDGVAGAHEGFASRWTRLSNVRSPYRTIAMRRACIVTVPPRVAATASPIRICAGRSLGRPVVLDELPRAGIHVVRGAHMVPQSCAGVLRVIAVVAERLQRGRDGGGRDVRQQRAPAAAQELGDPADGARDHRQPDDPASTITVGSPSPCDGNTARLRPTCGG